MSTHDPERPRRHFLLAAAAVAFSAAPCVARAQTPARTKRRIYMVTWRGPTDVEKGFVDYWKTQPGQVEFIWQDAAQNRNRLVGIAADIERTLPDLVFTWGTPATLGIAGSADKPHRLIGTRIPLVFAPVADPMAANIITSLGAHGRNISGVSHVAPLAAQIKVMRAYRAIRGVGIIYNQLEPNSLANVMAWRRAGKLEGFRVVAQSFPMNANNQLLPANVDMIADLVEQLIKGGVNWLYLGPDTHLFTQLDKVADAAMKRAIPTFASVESLINTSAPVLVGLVSKFYQVGQFAGYKAHKMLQGERNVHIDTLERFSLIVDLAVAKAISAYPPMGLIDYAEFRP